MTSTLPGSGHKVHPHSLHATASASTASSSAVVLGPVQRASYSVHHLAKNSKGPVEGAPRSPPAALEATVDAEIVVAAAPYPPSGPLVQQDVPVTKRTRLCPLYDQFAASLTVLYGHWAVQTVLMISLVRRAAVGRCVDVTWRAHKSRHRPDCPAPTVCNNFADRLCSCLHVQAWCLFAADSYTLLNVPDSANDFLYGSLSFTFVLFALEVSRLCAKEASLRLHDLSMAAQPARYFESCHGLSSRAAHMRAAQNETKNNTKGGSLRHRARRRVLPEILLLRRRDRHRLRAAGHQVGGGHDRFRRRPRPHRCGLTHRCAGCALAEAATPR
jgi:hypothetical protein